MEHLLHETAVGEKCNVCGMVWLTMLHLGKLSMVFGVNNRRIRVY